MQRKGLLALGLLQLVVLVCFVSSARADYQQTVQQILQASENYTLAYSRLAYMCDTFGPRLSGSEGLSNALEWILSEFEADGLDEPRLQPVMVPHWVRISESLQMKQPRQQTMAVFALGGSVSTPPEGIIAEALVVQSFDELKAKAAQAKGKIVIYNVPFAGYGATVVYRTQGAVEASKVGALASLTRSITPYSLYTPHTGSVSYPTDIPKIPAGAITIEDAEMLHRMQNRSQTIVLHLTIEATTLPDALSYNAIAEIKGSTRPDEVVVIGGHIDSWDKGQGAHDDGGGCIIAWHALNLIKSLGLRPARTIRAVMWTNEENGGKGAQAYYNSANINKTTFAMESDSGIFAPIGLNFQGTPDAMKQLQLIADLLAPTISIQVKPGGAGADVSALAGAGVPAAGLEVDEHNEGQDQYFWYHHTNADTIDKININLLNQCMGTMASIAYVIADMPSNLPR